MSSVNNTATEQISHQRKQQSLAKIHFSAVTGASSAQDFCAGIAKPVINTKKPKPNQKSFSSCKVMMIIKLTLESQEVLSTKRGQSFHFH